jgi:tRNA(fMet)-specific endonuclease VapC
LAFLIDTNIFIHARDGSDAVLNKFAEHSGKIFMSALSLAELQRGFDARLSAAALRRERHRLLLQHLPILPFDAVAAEAYGRIILQLGRIKAHDFDHMIAAHAVSTRSILVTNNAGDFAGIAGLSLEDWSQ